MCVGSWKWLNFLFIYSWAVQNSVMSSVSPGTGNFLLQEIVNTLVSTDLKTICGSSKKISSFLYALQLSSRNIFKAIWIRTELGLPAWIRDHGRKWKKHIRERERERERDSCCGGSSLTSQILPSNLFISRPSLYRVRRRKLTLFKFHYVDSHLELGMRLRSVAHLFHTVSVDSATSCVRCWSLL